LVHSDVWTFTDSDISLAQASNSLLVWFGVKIPTEIRKKAEHLKLELKTFEIIYELIDYLGDVAKWKIKVELKEVYLWRLKVMWIFFKREKEMVIWWKIIDWKITNWAQFRVHRWEEIIWQWKITSLQKEQENVNELSVWHMCWMKVRVSKKIIEEDELECFVIE
jgi:translation initiation factor IF-2